MESKIIDKDEEEKRVKKVARKLQLIDFVHFAYDHIDDMTIGQIMDEYRKTI